MSLHVFQVHILFSLQALLLSSMSHDLPLKHTLLQIKPVGAKRQGDYLVFLDNLKSSLTFFKIMCLLAKLFPDTVMHCLRHKTYNSLLIIGSRVGLLYFRPWLSVSALVDWLEIQPDACRCHKCRDAGGSAGQQKQQVQYSIEHL